MASLERAIALEPRIVFCNHRGPVEGGAEALRRKLEALRDLAGRVEKLHRQGWNPDDIARALPGGDLLWRLWTLGSFFKAEPRPIGASPVVTNRALTLVG